MDTDKFGEGDVAAKKTLKNDSILTLTLAKSRTLLLATFVLSPWSLSFSNPSTELHA